MFLTGDSGYGCRTWLMTPLAVAATDAERRYNEALASGRNIIERTFGLLKSRFRCLDRSGGALLYSPEVVGQIVMVCIAFHNVALRHGIPMQLEGEQQEEVEAAPVEPRENTAAGSQRRRCIIERHFS